MDLIIMKLQIFHSKISKNNNLNIFEFESYIIHFSKKTKIFQIKLSIGVM